MGSGARLAFAEVLSNELGIDLTPEFLAAVDRVLIGLWLAGFKIEPLEG
jgi:hypothetical protein